MVITFRFYIPKDYQDGKRDFKNEIYFVSEAVKFSEDTSIDSIFMQTKLSKYVSNIANQYYYKDAQNGIIHESIPDEIFSSNMCFALCPAIDVIVSDNKYHLKYFFIPTYKKVKLDLEKRFNYRWNISDLTRIHDLIIPNDGKRGRKIIYID
jgi:hypothetical protein